MQGRYPEAGTESEIMLGGAPDWIAFHGSLMLLSCTKQDHLLKGDSISSGLIICTSTTLILHPTVIPKG